MSVAILLSARRRPRPRLALLLLTLLLIAASLVHLGLGARWIAPQTGRRRCASRCAEWRCQGLRRR